MLFMIIVHLGVQKCSFTNDLNFALLPKLSRFFAKKTTAGVTDTAAKRLRMRSLRPFPVSSLCCSFSFGVLSNCPGTEFAGMALKSSKRRKIHPRVFPFSKKKKKKIKTGHFTLLFCRGRKRNVPECVTHVQSYCFAH